MDGKRDIDHVMGVSGGVQILGRLWRSSREVEEARYESVLISSAHPCGTIACVANIGPYPGSGVNSDVRLVD